MVGRALAVTAITLLAAASAARAEVLDRWTLDGRPVSVPGVANAAPVSGAAGRRGYEGAVATWRTSFDAPAAGRYAIRFGSVNDRAAVALDGRRLCAHTGAYEPFTCATTLTPGRHALALTADWRSPARQEREGHDRAWFNWGGPQWPVTVAPLPETDARLVGVATHLDGGDARVALTIELHDTRGSGPAHDVALGGTLLPPGATKGGTPVALTAHGLAPGQTRRVRRTITVARPQLWAPGSPRRYRLTLGGGAAISQLIGLRELSVRDGRLLLNGRRLVLHGAGMPADIEDHGDALTPADQDRLVGQLLEIGANATRAQMPLSDALLDKLDAAGILLWQIAGPFDKAGRFWAHTPARARQATRRALATVDREAAHPSLAIVSLANEVSGKGRPGQASYVGRTARAIRRRGNGTLVAADIWGSHLPRRATALYRDLDLVGVTEYIGLFEAAGAPAAEQARRARRRIALLRDTFAHLPLVVSEFGANANAGNPAGRVGSYDYQAQLLRRRIALYQHDRDVSGMLVWVLRDYAVAPDFFGGTLRDAIPGVRFSPALNEKGLFTYDGLAKPAVAVVQRAFRSS